MFLFCIFICNVNWSFPLPTFPFLPSNLQILSCLLSVVLTSISVTCYNVNWWFALVQVTTAAVSSWVQGPYGIQGTPSQLKSLLKSFPSFFLSHHGLHNGSVSKNFSMSYLYRKEEWGLFRKSFNSDLSMGIKGKRKNLRRRTKHSQLWAWAS